MTPPLICTQRPFPPSFLSAPKPFDPFFSPLSLTRSAKSPFRQHKSRGRNISPTINSSISRFLAKRYQNSVGI